MPYPLAIHFGNADANEINVRPNADQAAGVGFYDPESGRFVIPQRALKSGELAAARDNGVYRCLKENTSDIFNPGDTLSFSGGGVIAGADPLTVTTPSPSGERYVFAELNQSTGGGGGGLNTTQVNNLIDQATTRSFIESTALDDTPPVDADWPEGQAPQENDILWIVRTPVNRNVQEWWRRNATADSWTQLHVIVDDVGGQTSEPERSEFVSIVEIPPGTPIDMNGATGGFTAIQDLNYALHDPGTAATFDSIYGRDLIAYVNGVKVEQSLIERNDGDPAGRVRFSITIPNGSEIVFESQVVS